MRQSLTSWLFLCAVAFLFTCGASLGADNPIAGNKNVADNRWHHVVITGEENSLIIYVDGREDATGNLDARQDVKGHIVKIGYTSNNFPDPSGFTGQIAEEEILFEPLWPLLERDFSDDTSKEQIEWERKDGIWTNNFKPGDFNELANRYAYACSATPTIATRAMELAPKVHNAKSLDKIRQVYYRSKRYAPLQKMLKDFDIAGLKNTIERLEDYVHINANKYRRDLLDIEDRLNHLDVFEPMTSAQIEEFQKDLTGLRHDVLLAENPLMDFNKIVFVKRYTYQSSHYYTDFIDGVERFGGNLCVLDLDTAKVTDIVPSMSEGIFGRFDLSYDGKKIVFDYKAKDGVGFRIYEVNVDGTGLRQLTFPPEDEEKRMEKYWLKNMAPWAGRSVKYRHHTDDMHPCYLPDGGICFISTRCEFGILCDAPDYFTTTVLYRMDADGGNMQKLSNSSVSEASPSVINDGRVLYTRWEYLDKGAVSVKCLWAMRPDGTGSAEVYGNDIAVPTTFLYGRAIPGYNNLFVSLITLHCCPINGIGGVVLVDTNKDIRTTEPIHYITPDIRIPDSGHHGILHKRNGQWVSDLMGPLFIDVYPLDRETFLVSQNKEKLWNDFSAWDLYLLFDGGDTMPLYDDPEYSCYQPTPLRARIKPPPLNSAIDPKLAQKNLANLVVTDVYAGLDGVKRGTIKYIRINEQVPRPWAARRRWDGDEYDQQHAVITKATHLGLKVQHGIVPVESDGSAHFTVPADRNIFFQVLDENFMEVQRERTYVNYRPGETRSCIGCHERPNLVPESVRSVPLAIQRQPSTPGPQPGEETGRRILDYVTDVQPILDKHCVKCHSGEEPKGIDLSGELTTLFNKSYENLIDRRLIPLIGENHPKWENVHYVPPYTLGSHASKLIKILLDGHEDIKLTKEEMVKLTTWVDSNGQYYGSYYGRRNLQYKDHPNFRPKPTFNTAISLLPPLKESDR